MIPSIGRIVHYRSYGSADGTYLPECRAAIVTETLGNNTVNLTIFNPNGLFFNDCAEDQSNIIAGTWHWPERVD